MDTLHITLPIMRIPTPIWVGAAATMVATIMVTRRHFMAAGSTAAADFMEAADFTEAAVTAADAGN